MWKGQKLKIKSMRPEPPSSSIPSSTINSHAKAISEVQEPTNDTKAMTTIKEPKAMTNDVEDDQKNKIKGKKIPQ